MNIKVINLQKMDYLNVVNKPIDEKRLNAKFTYKRRLDEEGMQRKYISLLMMSEDETNDAQHDSFWRVTDITLAKLILCLSIESGWLTSYMDSDNAIQSGRFGKSIHAW